MKSLLISCCAGVSGGMYLGHLGEGAAGVRPVAGREPFAAAAAPSRGRSCGRAGDGTGASGDCFRNGDVRGMLVIVITVAAAPPSGGAPASAAGSLRYRIRISR